MGAPETPSDSPLALEDVMSSPGYRSLMTPELGLGDPAFPFDLRGASSTSLSFEQTGGRPSRGRCPPAMRFRPGRTPRPDLGERVVRWHTQRPQQAADHRACPATAAPAVDHNACSPVQPLRGDPGRLVVEPPLILGRNRRITVVQVFKLCGVDNVERRTVVGARSLEPDD